MNDAKADMHACALRPGKAYRILIVDDHPIVRSGLCKLIEEQRDMLVAGEAESAVQALEGLGEARAHLALIDISLKGMDGLELIKHARARQPDLAVLVVSMHDENLYAERALRAGAGGYIMKQEAADKVILAIRRVLRGETYLSDRMYGLFAKRVAGGAGDSQASALRNLSDRELEIFNLMGKGRRVKDVAEDLGISAKTVATHCAHLSRKLGLRGTVDLMQYAIRWAASQSA